jgi:hypothetical protein
MLKINLICRGNLYRQILNCFFRGRGIGTNDSGGGVSDNHDAECNNAEPWGEGPALMINEKDD